MANAWQRQRSKLELLTGGECAVPKVEGADYLFPCGLRATHLLVEDAAPDMARLFGAVHDQHHVGGHLPGDWKIEWDRAEAFPQGRITYTARCSCKKKG